MKNLETNLKKLVELAEESKGDIVINYHRHSGWIVEFTPKKLDENDIPISYFNNLEESDSIEDAIKCVQRKAQE